VKAGKQRLDTCFCYPISLPVITVIFTHLTHYDVLKLMEETTDSNDELKDLPKVEPIDPIQETIPVAEPEPLNSKSEIEAMEVHHHPKLHDKPKKGKEYFLEFLMIFLAVTMGFIAENIREHFTEHKNANILAQSLLEDVKQDTASLHSLISFSNKKILAADSIIAMAHTGRDTWNPDKFYHYMVPMVSSLPFKSYDGTYSQMKTSGALRLFHQSLVNIMNAYDVQLRKTIYRDEVEDKGTWLLGDMMFDKMNLEVLNDLRFNKQVEHEMFINIDNKQTTDRFINLLSLIRGFRMRSLQEYQNQLTIAEKLIATLQKEYSLD
jgi:hypothetical protein